MSKNFMDYDNAEDVLTGFANDIKGNQNKTLSAPIVVKGQNCNTVESALNAIADAINGDIPNGRTVIPTDDIETWLACADIDESYTTLNEVLADSVTLSTLISDANACNYLVRSTTWISGICANTVAMTYIGVNNYCAFVLLADSIWRTAICNSSYWEDIFTTKVPAMTSNTTPSGVASASTTAATANRKAYNTFDRNTGNDGWLSASGVTISDQWLCYEFPNDVIIYVVTIMNNANEVQYDYGVQDYDIEAYDGTNWVVIGTGVVTKDVVNTSKTISSAIVQTNKVRIHCKSNHGGYNDVVGINIAQFYGRLAGI